MRRTDSFELASEYEAALKAARGAACLIIREDAAGFPQKASLVDVR